MTWNAERCHKVGSCSRAAPASSGPDGQVLVMARTVTYFAVPNRTTWVVCSIRETESVDIRYCYAVRRFFLVANAMK